MLLILALFSQTIGTTALRLAPDAPYLSAFDEELPLLTTDETDWWKGDEMAKSLKMESWPWEKSLSLMRQAIEAESAHGFAARPVREQWEQRLLEVVGRSRGDPCSADVLISGFNWGQGFFSRIILVMNELGLAMYFNKSVAVCNGSRFVEDIWQKYYTPIQIEVCEKSAMCDGSILQANVGNDLAVKLLKVDRNYLWDFKEFIYKRMFVLKPSSIESIAKHWTNMSFNTSDQHIGVHIRHGDKASEAQLLPFESYANAIREAQQSHGVPHSVYIASDDSSAGDLVRALLNKDGLMYTVCFDFDSLSDQRNYTNEASQIALLADFEGLRTARVFIGTQSSNMGRIAFYARGIKKVSQSLDGEWGSFDWT